MLYRSSVSSTPIWYTRCGKRVGSPSHALASPVTTVAAIDFASWLAFNEHSALGLKRSEYRFDWSPNENFIIFLLHPRTKFNLSLLTSIIVNSVNNVFCFACIDNIRFLVFLWRSWLDKNSGHNFLIKCDEWITKRASIFVFCESADSCHFSELIDFLWLLCYEPFVGFVSPGALRDSVI